MSVNEVKLKKATTPLTILGNGPATSRTFCIGDEDHTLGNALRHILIRQRDVNFAGYSVPHPSEPFVHIRVQTSSDETAAAALHQSCQTLSQQCQLVLEQLERLVPATKEDRIRIEEALLEDAEDDEDEMEE
ncbi:DNA-directed RNA polymerases I and III subunit RPAC2 [Fistulifera solaris]|jgi:DNA-directed RNA polymerase I and III subunit RPAC2|uniref:DNA-directed RNA polymerases I and III subunit RPAC2 n=1 Tax=Fistulifera solaris TaxID=1519565 RepID=A0A1Z5JA43_FISSO|nr:DNA-directed RNA polymerases I and III subunit RPAC2 [Fistulifera solaris]|eukprot:GAX10850.1 DNA-directed RNA polymerases I and III subunit RPAC2 [Fistulifera solaris]